MAENELPGAGRSNSLTAATLNRTPMSLMEKRCQEPSLTKGWGFDRNAGRGRPLRTMAGGLVYHLLNRANARMQIFDNEKDYHAFERNFTCDGV